MVLRGTSTRSACGAKIYASWPAGMGMTLHDRGIRAARARGCLDASIDADQVQCHLNAAAPSRRWATSARTSTIKLAFGEHAKRLGGQLHQSMTSRLLGSAGGRSVFSVLALHPPGQPPTINIFDQDPQCDRGLLRQRGARMKDQVRGEEQLRLRRSSTLVVPPGLIRQSPDCRRYIRAAPRFLVVAADGSRWRATPPPSLYALSAMSRCCASSARRLGGTWDLRPLLPAASGLIAAVLHARCARRRRRGSFAGTAARSGRWPAAEGEFAAGSIANARSGHLAAAALPIRRPAAPCSGCRSAALQPAA